MKPSIAVAAGLAVAAHAFLVPPEVVELSPADANAFNPVPTDSFLVELPCPGCPVQIKKKNGKIRMKTNKENHLNFLFKIENEDGTDKLMVNGYELYPHNNPFINKLTAPQTIDHRKHKNGKWAEKHKDFKGPRRGEVISPELGYNLVWNVHGFGNDKTKVFMELQIIEVGNQFVNDIPKIVIMVDKDQEGHLSLDAAQAVSHRPAMHAMPLPTQKECNSAMCQWLSYIKGKLGRPVGNCASKNKHGSPGGTTLQSHHKLRPGQFRHHRPQRTWGQLVKNVLRHILLPIFIGIIAGVGASILGMMVGTFAVMVWRTLFRRNYPRCGGATRCKASRKEAADADEKAGLMDEESLPPAYEEDDTREIVERNVEEEVTEETQEDAPKA